MRHGFAGRSLQYVPGFFFEFAGRAGPDEQFSKRKGRSGPCCAAGDDPATGQRQLVSDFLLRQEVNPWAWVLFGWVGTLLVGSQVTKLIMEGIHLIYGDRERHSFLGRQLRGLLLFCVSIVAWLVAVGLSIFGRPLRQWIAGEFGPSPLVRGFWTVMLPVLGVILTMLVLALIYHVARPGATTWRSVQIRSARSGCGCDSMVGRQSTVWNLRSEDTVWTCLRRAGRGDRFDGMDGVLFDDRLFWRGLERRKRCTGRLILMHNSPVRTPPLFFSRQREAGSSPLAMPVARRTL
jgi:hypothetical protein